MVRIRWALGHSALQAVVAALFSTGWQIHNRRLVLVMITGNWCVTLKMIVNAFQSLGKYFQAAIGFRELVPGIPRFVYCCNGSGKYEREYNPAPGFCLRGNNINLLDLLIGYRNATYCYATAMNVNITAGPQRVAQNTVRCIGII